MKGNTLEDNTPESITPTKIWLLGQNPGATFKGGGQNPGVVIQEKLSKDKTHLKKILFLSVSYTLKSVKHKNLYNMKLLCYFKLT